MYGALHEIEVKPVEGRSPINARILIDGKPVRCRNYDICHRLDEVPTIILELYAVHKVKERGFMEIRDLKEFALLLKPGEFEEFCNLWHAIHDEEKK